MTLAEIEPSLILFTVGLLAGVVNVMAGGGSTLTLPALIFLGLDTATANGTNRVAIFLQNVFAALSFWNQKVTGFRSGLLFGLWTVPGAVVGALVAVQISDEWFRRILGLVMIGVVISMLIPQKRKDDALEGDHRSWLIYPALFAIGFYGGFIQVGVGLIFMAAFYHILHMNLVLVNLNKVLCVLIYTIPSLFIFAASGHVDWVLGLSLAAGNSVGGWMAARWTVKRGEKLVRYVLVVAIVIMAGKIVGLY